MFQSSVTLNEVMSCAAQLNCVSVALLCAAKFNFASTDARVSQSNFVLFILHQHGCYHIIKNILGTVLVSVQFNLKLKMLTE